MIRAEGLTRDFGTTRALDGLTFDVAAGEVYGLLGPNGAGKTTAMRLLSGLLRPTSGTALVDGFAVDSQARSVRTRVGLLTEVPGLYLRLRPVEYLDFFAQLHGLHDSTARRKRVHDMLELVGLWERRNDGMRTFSKGMQQRVAIARTLIHAPAVLLLDEPTAALDPEAARNVRDHVRDLTAQGRTVLLSTHNLHEAELLCQRLSIVQGGRQIVEGRPADLRRRTGHTCVLHLRAPSETVLDQVRQVAGVGSATANGTSIHFRAQDPAAVNPAVVRAAVAAGADVMGLVEHEATLEDVYLSLIAQPPAPLPARTAQTLHVREVTRGRRTRGAAWLIVQRELREMIRDPNMLVPLLVLPILIGLMAGLTSFASFGSQSGSIGTAVTTAALDQLPPAAVQRLNNVPLDNRIATLETLLKAFSIPLFWVIPVALAPALAADSFVGERERSSLEPLLATPVRMPQVLLGKLLASSIPAVIGTWLGVLVYWLITLFSRSPLHSRTLLTDTDWLFSLLVVTPLVALFTTSVAALISTRVSGFRVAYQLNGLVALPLVLLVIPAAAFGFLLSPWALVLVAAALAVLTLGLVLWSLRLYDRERLLSRP